METIQDQIRQYTYPKLLSWNAVQLIILAYQYQYIKSFTDPALYQIYELNIYIR